jgi:transposase-like protein
MAQRVTTTPPNCPHCDDRRVDEYTHYDCPKGAAPESHRHWVCSSCDWEWITQIAE